MKKKRLLSGLLVFAFMFSLLSTSVFAAVGESRVLSDEPFDYMTNLKTRSFESYESLSTGEKKLVYTIPEGVAETLTTEALLKTILNNPYISDIFFYSSLEEGIKCKDFRFHFTELFNRKDVIIVLDAYINELSERLSIDGKKYDEIEIDELPDDEFSLLYEYIVCNSLYDYLINNLSTYSNVLRYGIVEIQTLGGLWLEGKTNRSWANVFGGEAKIKADERKLESDYPNAIKLQDRSPVYNCHCYAWHTNYTTADAYIWIESEDAVAYLQDSHCSLKARVEPGCQVVYFKEDDHSHMAHSGFVTGVSGYDVYVVSKMGNCGVYRHLLKDCPYYEESGGYINYYTYN